MTRAAAVGIFPPNLFIFGDKISKYTARPPRAYSGFRAGFVLFYGVKRGLFRLRRIEGGRMGTNGGVGSVTSKKGLSRAKKQ